MELVERSVTINRLWNHAVLLGAVGSGLRASTRVLDGDRTHGPEPRALHPEPRGVFQHPVNVMAPEGGSCHGLPVAIGDGRQAPPPTLCFACEVPGGGGELAK